MRANRPARIYTDHCYLAAYLQGISGTTPTYTIAIVSGHVYRRDLLWMQPLPPHGNLNTATFRLDNGRLPDYQPRATYAEACAWVSENPYSAAVLTVNATS